MVRMEPPLSKARRQCYRACGSQEGKRSRAFNHTPRPAIKYGRLSSSHFKWGCQSPRSLLPTFTHCLYSDEADKVSNFRLFWQSPIFLAEKHSGIWGGGLRAAVTSRPQAGKEQAPPLLLPAPILQQTLRAPSQAVLQGLNFTKESL